MRSAVVSRIEGGRDSERHRENVKGGGPKRGRERERGQREAGRLAAGENSAERNRKRIINPLRDGEARGRAWRGRESEARSRGGREGAKGRLRESGERAPGPEAGEGAGEHREAGAGRDVEGRGRCGGGRSGRAPGPRAPSSDWADGALGRREPGPGGGVAVAVAAPSRSGRGEEGGAAGRAPGRAGGQRGGVTTPAACEPDCLRGGPPPRAKRGRALR